LTRWYKSRPAADVETSTMDVDPSGALDRMRGQPDEVGRGGLMPLPELNDDARREALNKAAEARKLRAEMKQRLKAGEIDLNSVLNRAADDEVIAKTRVSEVLEALPKVGRVRARRLMERLDISSSRRLRGLGSNQRERLLAEFDDR